MMTRMTIGGGSLFVHATTTTTRGCFGRRTLPTLPSSLGGSIATTTTLGSTTTSHKTCPRSRRLGLFGYFHLANCTPSTLTTLDLLILVIINVITILVISGRIRSRPRFSTPPPSMMALFASFLPPGSCSSSPLPRCRRGTCSRRYNRVERCSSSSSSVNDNLRLLLLTIHYYYPLFLLRFVVVIIIGNLFFIRRGFILHGSSSSRRRPNVGGSVGLCNFLDCRRRFCCQYHFPLLDLLVIVHYFPIITLLDIVYNILPSSSNSSR